MEGVSFVLVGATIAKICAFSAGVTTLNLGLKWFSTFDPTFKKNVNSKKGGENDDAISERVENLSKKLRA
jgi:hypothetical protein